MTTFPAAPPTSLSQDGKLDLGPHSDPTPQRAPSSPVVSLDQDGTPSDVWDVANLPLDIFPGALVAYSYRKIRSAYAGAAIQARRDVDNVLLDVGFVANGDWDIPSYHAWIGAGTAHTQKWYDQSGNGYDQIQASAALQPIPHAPNYPANSVTGSATEGASGIFMAAPNVAGLNGIWDNGGFVLVVVEIVAGIEEPLIGKGTNPNGWLFFLYHTGDAPETYQAYFNWTGTTAANTKAAPKMALSPKRHVLSCAWDKSKLAVPADMTIDGVAAAVASSTTGASLGSEAGALEVLNETSIQSNNTALNGLLYEVIAWKSKPSPDVLAALLANLVAYYGN